MTTLEVVDSAESQAAVAYLLNLVMKRWDLDNFFFIYIYIKQNFQECRG